MLFQCLTFLMIFALTGYQAVTSKSDISSIIIYFYCGDISAELFLYCWFGNEMTEESRKLGFALYDSKWYNYSSEFKKMMIIFQQNTQKDLYYTCGGFVKLSLQTFTNVCSFYF